MIGAAARVPVLVRPQGWAGWAPVRALRRKPLGAVAATLILAMVLVALLADLLTPYDINDSFAGKALAPPFGEFLLGTDHFARDILTRIIHGARVSLAVGVGAVAVGITLGALVGLISGYAEGKLDLAIQRVMDAQLSFPNIILALAIVAIVGPGLFNVILAIAVVLVPECNRVVRGTVLSAKQQVYVEAARCIGGGTVRILWRHLLPNVAAPIMVIASLGLARAILTEANLSFLGVGLPKTIPSWGGMLSDEARRYLLAQPWLAVWPALAVSVAILSWNLLGDALRDLLDPRLRGSR